MSRKLTEQIPSESRLVDAALKENLKTIFERLERPLCLKAVLEPIRESVQRWEPF